MHGQQNIKLWVS